eukprot:TRINITY_DN58193_c0_g1_i1.p1 TRINITY_DN58193_c0_g1~~TRINITY_DN58193_c0_g1_i1.p1  ORF type:complete len:408 (-),score=52.08 TRINITY_DN58193_c0_g1_i1:92-1315(-)
MSSRLHWRWAAALRGAVPLPAVATLCQLSFSQPQTASPSLPCSRPRPPAACEGFGRIWAWAGPQPPQEGISAVLEAVRPATASVFVVEADRDANGSLQLEDLCEQDVVFVGSGFTHDAGRFFVTCAHLFEGRWGMAKSRPLVLRFGDGSWALAELWGSCVQADVAVLRMLPPASSVSNMKPRPALTMSVQEPLPKQGEHVVVYGASQHGFEGVGLSGLVSQPRQAFRGLTEEMSTHFIQLALPTLPGMSGSPVVDTRGGVIGMVAKKFEEHGLAVPAARVGSVAACLEAGFAWRPPTLGLELQLGGSLIEPTVVVLALRPKSAAEAAGVRAGDEVLAVQGSPVASVLDVRSALLDLGDVRVAGASTESQRVEVSLRLRRAGKELRVVVDAPRAAPATHDTARNLSQS